MHEFMTNVLAGKLSGHDYTGVDVASVVVTGLSVVFIGLVLLIIFVTIYGQIFHKINSNKKAKAEAAKKAAENNAPKAEVVSSPAPVVEDGIEEEVVAVIMAAVSAMNAQSGKTFALKSVRKSVSQRSAWSSAGLVDNTRPF